MNINSLLNFEAPNKTDAIVVEATRKIPYHVQNYLRDNMDSEDAKDPLTLVQKAYGGAAFDKRDIKYTNGVKFLLRLKKGTCYYNFTDSEIEKIIQYTASRKPGEIVNILFENENLSAGEVSSRSSSVKALQEALGREYKGPAEVYNESEDEGNGEYLPPLTDETVIRKINKADPSADIAKHRLSSFDRKCVRALKANLALQKFCLTINSFKNSQERQLFEVEFIRATYNKPDMIPDDINACMMLCGEYVREMQIREMMNLIDAHMKAALSGDAKANMVFADNMTSKVNELNKCQANIKALQKSLNDSRTKRLEVESKLHESLSQFVHLITDQEGREKLNRATAAYNENILGPEIEKIKGTPQEVGEIHGMGIMEIFGFSHQIND